MASAALPDGPAAAQSNIIDIDAGSDLSDPPAGPSRDSSVLSPPPGDPSSAAASSSGKKKISLSQSKPIKTSGNSARTPSKKAAQNGNGKAVEKEESPEASGSWQPPIPVPRLVPTAMEDDWQVPYIWAFIDKFEVKVKGLFTIDDLETGLNATEPNDVLVEIFLIFLNNLHKKGVKKASADTLTDSLSKFIDARLQPGMPSTVWDPYAYTPYVQRRPKSKSKAAPAANGKGKGKAAVKADDEIDGEQEDDSALAASRRAADAKLERLGRNPLLEDGLWGLGWHGKATLLRQLVDWQLVECEAIRGYIDELYSSKKLRKETPITLEPLNKDSENKRIWAFEPTHRLYTQTNPLHFASEWHQISHDEDTYNQVLDKYVAAGAEHGQKSLERRKAKGKAAKAKAAKAEAGALRDYEISEALRKRKDEIDAFQVTLDERRTKFKEAQVRARKKRERDEANEAYRAGLVQHQTRRSTRNAAINYKEPVEGEFSEEEAEEPSYTRPKRGRRSDESAADTPNGHTNDTTADVTMDGSDQEDGEDKSDGKSSRASSFRADQEEEEESNGGSEVAGSEDEGEDGKRARSEHSDEETSGGPLKKRRVVVADSEDDGEYTG